MSDADRRRDPRSDVAATTSLAAAAATHWQAIVIGAGPAGAAVATRLAARGLAVLLVDAAAMPRPKLCGCCLSPTALGELAALHRLAREVHQAPAAAIDGGLPPGSRPLARVCLATAAVTAVVPMPRGAVVSREALDADGVRRAIAAGAAWLPRTRATTLADEQGRVTVGLASAADPASRSPTVSDTGSRSISDTGSLTAEIAIVATGLGDAIRCAGGADGGERRVAADSRVGLGTTLPADAGGPPPGDLVMAVSRRGYCGVVRLEDGRIDIAAAVDRGLVAAAGSPAAAIAGLLAETGGERAANLGSPAAAERLAVATFRGTPPLTRRRLVASPSGRILRIGDAAGYVEPFTGEGIGWALAAARLCDEALGPLVTPAGRMAGDIAAAGIRYAFAHGRHFAAHHARCRRVALVVRRPWLVGPALRLARLAPAVAARVVPLVVGGTPAPQAHG
jgi:flavin-dependent dehydrogenase